MGFLQVLSDLFCGSEAPVRSTRTAIGGRVAHGWEERGWRRVGDTLRGYYRTRRGSYAGRIEGINGSPSYYIIDPPAQLLSGSHGACFRERGERGFFIHWNVHPKNVDDGIINVERLLLEALS